MGKASFRDNQFLMTGQDLVIDNKKWPKAKIFSYALLLWWTSGDNVYTQDDHKTIIAYSDFIYENLPEINKETERWIGIL